MHESIKVKVISHHARKNLTMRYTCPDTGKYVDRSTGTSNRREAERKAAKWEAELQEGRYKKPSRWTWEEFRDHHRKNILDHMKASTAGSYESALNVFEQHTSPKKLSDVTTARVTAFVTKLRELGRRPATIAHHLRHLKVVLRWAKRQGLLHELPEFDMPKHQKGMKGRPITLEEFERMLTATHKAVTTCDDADLLTSTQTAVVDSWKFYLRGLWESGLRLDESVTLRWDDSPGCIVVDLAGRRPMMRVPAESEKGGKNRLLPITPEFAALLESVPRDQRKGRVFRLLTKDGEPVKPSRFAVGPRVSAIGEKAGVIVNQRDKDGETVNSYASAHDLRRAFGFRWSRRVMPTVLRELMRHESIETTMKYYVGINAEATADELWKAVGDKTGDKVAEAGLEPARGLPPTGF